MSWQETTLPPQESKPQRVWEEVRTAHNRHSAPSKQLGKPAHKTPTQCYSLQHLKFPGPWQAQSITNSKAEKSFCPQPGPLNNTQLLCYTGSQQQACTRKLDCTKAKCNFSLRLCCPLHIVDRSTCTFTAAFLSFRLETLRKRVIAMALQNQQVWCETSCFTSTFIQYNTGLLKQLGPNNKHLLRNSLLPPDIPARAQRYP